MLQIMVISNLSGAERKPNAALPVGGPEFGKTDVGGS
jgi:hypothetical protein